MGDFFFYAQIGFAHITDTGAYDHILFVITLCAAFKPSEWRQVLLLATAFTFGHSLSLAASALGWVSTRPEWVETLIPLTILCAASENLYALWKQKRQNLPFKYTETVFFGLIHGLGFSYYLKALLGSEGSVTIPLLGFNAGLELGQALVTVFFLGLLAIFAFFNILQPKYYYRATNIAVFLLAAEIAFRNMYGLFF